MARKTTSFSIEGREGQVELRELKTKHIISILQIGKENKSDSTNKDSNDESKSDGRSLGDFKQIIKEYLPKCSNLKINEFYDMAPSEIELVWNKFKEVNSVFLKVSQQMGINQLLGDLKVVILEAISEDFSKLLASSLKKDIQELSIMDTPSS